MKNSTLFPKSGLVKGLMGYVIIIALVLMIGGDIGQDLAIMLANGIIPLFFFVLGSLLVDGIDVINDRLQRSDETQEAEG